MISNKAAAETGFGLINSIHMSIFQVFMKELKNEEEKNKSSDPSTKEANEQDEDHLLTEIRKNIEKPELVWTELVRLILTSHKKFDFQPLDDHIV